MTPQTNANFRAFPALLQGLREFDEPRGYVASAPNLREPVVALSLGGQRRRIDAGRFEGPCDKGQVPARLLRRIQNDSGGPARFSVAG
jgi:hypothetical protein